MSTIEIKQLSFSYDGAGLTLFDHVELNIDTTWKLGLIGRNGRGKTTFFKLLQDELAYSGTINHQMDFSYFPQAIKDKNKMTYEIIDDLKAGELWEVERELTLLGTETDILWRDFSSLSGGEQTKVLLAILFSQSDYFPLIDEPTNHLDALGRKQVASYLRQKKTGFIVISHDRLFIDEVCDHILAIDKSQITISQGNYSTYQFQKERQDESEQEKNEKLKKEVGRLKQTAAKKAEWSYAREGDKYGSANVKNSGAINNTGFIGARAARAMKKSKNLLNRMDKEIEEKEKLLKNIEFIDPLTMNFVPSHHKTLLTVENFTLSFNDEPLFKPVSFDIKQGERVAIIGANGVGKTSFIKAILDKFEGNIEGQLTKMISADWSLVRQNYEVNQGTLKAFCLKHHLDYQDFLSNIKKLGLERQLFSNNIETMSMGQRKKIEIAKSLTEETPFYLWDEPLNYLDIFNYEQLEEIILLKEPTMLFVEHDEAFINKVATKVITLEKY
ncbi:ribosomal protection-like ABC-F family protein [Vagococcus hydrophili]|uniref:ABC-F type ribosomal protection protein n=1 Tax=Vagococcus hydrophili TaxID=2714947 RepID=A0A6G8AV23_9ENTE|nr:ABC-F type ribosomal protection protein [Vagococcus hydrophili]QIL48802.1 ABC-F type ribosomal protection protein [Vagococcus hydrophili]